MKGFPHVVFSSAPPEAWPIRDDNSVNGLGVLLARGRTSDVYALGTDSVVKVPRVGVPRHWAAVEASIAASVHQIGLPTPEVRDMMDVDGRESIVFERIHGPSMWQMLLDDPARVPTLIEQMIEVQRTINSVEAPAEVPKLDNRICAKISEADSLTAQERQTALAITVGLPSGASLCHGDLHPGNILMGSGGPVVIDWFDAGVGHRAADSVRTSLLIRPPTSGLEPPHLPGASSELLQSMHELYLRDVVARSGGTVPELLQWERVLAVSRLAEHADVDHDELLVLWRSTDGPRPQPTQLASALTLMGFVAD